MERNKLHKKILGLTMTVLLTLGFAIPTNGIVYASNDIIGENEALSYAIEKNVNDDASSVEVILNMEKKGDINVQKVVLPDGTEQKYSDTFKVNVIENGKLNFKIKYEKVNAESGEIDIPVDITEIVHKEDNKKVNNESTEKSIDKNSQNKEQTVAKQSKLDESLLTTLDISKGSITIGADSITAVDEAGNAVTTINSNGYIILGSSATNSVKLNGVVTTVILRNTNVAIASSTNPMEIKNSANVTLQLDGTNTFESSYADQAGIYVEENSSVTIKSDSDGILNAVNTQATRGAGLGAMHNKNSGNITILSGTINASGRVGIGGNLKEDTKITISGGTVSATGSTGGAGIGSYSSTGGTILIDGGTVVATGGAGAAGIGLGSRSSGGSVTISGNAEVSATGGSEAAGIGTGQTGTAIDITISDNPNITAKGDRGDIGGGGQAANMIGTITISGGVITTKGAGTGIGDGTTANGLNSDIHISNAQIIGETKSRLVFGKNIVIENSTMEYSGNGNSGIQASADIAITNSSISMRGSIYAPYGNVTIQDSDSIIANGIGASTSAGTIAIENSNLKLLNSTSSNIIAASNIHIISGDIEATHKTQSTSNYGLYANKSLKIDDGKLITTAIRAGSGSSNPGSLEINGGHIETARTIASYYGTGIVINGGYVHVGKNLEAIGDIKVYDGYIDVQDTLMIRGNFFLDKKANGTGGNGVIVSKVFELEEGSGNANFENGIFGIRSNSNSYTVYGDVTIDWAEDTKDGCDHINGNHGSILTIPDGMEFFMDDDSELIIPTDKRIENYGSLNHNQGNVTIKNGGSIVNHKWVYNCITVNVEDGGSYINEKDAYLRNYYKGSIVGAGTKTNKGNLLNEIWFDHIKLDNQVWNGYPTLSLKTVGGEKREVKPKTFVTNGDKEDVNPVIWADQGNNTLQPDGKDTVKTITTNWSWEKAPLDFYTLTFDANYTDAPTMTDTKIALNGSNYAGLLPTEPTRPGYTFLGWNTNKDGTGTNIQNATDVVALSAPTTLYAKWNTPDIHKVDFVDWDGTVLKSEDVIKGEDATAPVEPTREGYTFTGWDKTFTNIQNNLTITANYIINKHTVKYEFATDGPNGIKPPSGVIVDYGSKTSESTMVVPTGWEFDGWYVDKECTEKFDFETAIKMDITLYGKWFYKGKPLEPVNPSQPNKPSTEKPSVDTGDTTQAGMYVLLAGTAFIVLLVIRKNRIRKKL